jgi:hypothetical protein
VDSYGATPANVTDVEIFAIIPDAKFTHIFESPTTQRLTPFLMEIGYQDIDVPFFDRFIGCRVLDRSETLGADEELIVTRNIVALDVQRSYIPYDAADHAASTKGTISISGGAGGATTSSDHTASVVGDFIVYEQNGVYYRAQILTRTNGTTYVLRNADGSIPANITGATVVEIYSSTGIAVIKEGGRFTNAKATASLNGVSGRMTTALLTISNELDLETYELTGDGTRADVNEGFLTVSGELTVRLTDSLVVNIGRAGTIVPMIMGATANNGDTISYSIPSTKQNGNGAEVSGPAGVVYTTQFMAHSPTPTSGTITITLTNEWGAY